MWLFQEICFYHSFQTWETNESPRLAVVFSTVVWSWVDLRSTHLSDLSGVFWDEACGKIQEQCKEPECQHLSCMNGSHLLCCFAAVWLAYRNTTSSKKIPRGPKHFVVTSVDVRELHLSLHFLIFPLKYPAQATKMSRWVFGTLLWIYNCPHVLVWEPRSAVF